MYILCKSQSGLMNKEKLVATMADIARRAGVALSTVSHTLSGKRPVSVEVRERVLRAIEELEYQPHALARALATKRTRTIALLYPTLPEPQFEFISGILKATNERKYGLLLWTAPDDDQDMLQLIQQGFIDGLILMEVRLEDQRVAVLKEQNYPFTMIGHCADNDGLNFVDLDFDYAIHTSVDYLAQSGHRHIGFINHELSLLEAGAGYVVRAEHAFHQAIAEHGLVGHSLPCTSAPEAGYEAANTLLVQDPALSAIITSNTWVYGGITRAMHDRELRIPDDISLVGIIPPRIAEMVSPMITSIDFPFYEMGHMAADNLLRQLEGEEIFMQVMLKPQLTVRQSSGLRRNR
jgi:DNA-binding LacI/PurR family transcriptional regulator